jgi:hypothetical protein
VNEIETDLASDAALLSGAYANTLTNLIPDLYAGLDVVSRELVGFIPSVFRNASAERAAVGQAVVYPITPTMGTFNVTPSNVPPNPADLSIGNGSITITKSKGVEFGWTGEEQRGLNTGPGYLSVQADLFAQGLRTLVNEIETDLASDAALNFSRAYGTPGTTAFASDVGASAQMKKIIDDNGAPQSGRSMVIDTSAGANLRTLKQLTAVNEAGTSMTLRDGELLNLNGFSIKESAGVQNPVAGTGANATTDNAGYAVGATTITLASAGTGTILAGDIITFAGDDNKYVVASGDADVSGGGTITLVAPGLREAIAASATNITVVGQAARNAAFSQNALHLVARAPALPVEGDMAIDRMLLTDPRSGLVFEVALYAMYRKIRAEIVMAWGTKTVKPEHGALLLG